MDLGGWEKADMANRYRKIAPTGLGEELVVKGWTQKMATGPKKALQTAWESAQST